MLAWADVLVHPSLTEAFGVAVIEAQAMGLPVVCSDAGGLPENVEHEVTGFVVGRRDPEGIADRLAELARDASLRRRMGRAARRRAETVLSLEHQLDGFEQLYEDLLAEPAQVPGAGVATARAEASELERDALARELADLQARQDALRLQLWRQEVIEELRAVAGRALPEGAEVLVVSRGDELAVALPGVRASHFPRTADGEYAGHHPADSADAIARLEDLRAQGAAYLAVPATQGWWLEHYEGFARHLTERYTRMPESGEHVVLFALEPRHAAVPA
jgi:hypothetical protein